MKIQRKWFLQLAGRSVTWGVPHQLLVRLVAVPIVGQSSWPSVNLPGLRATASGAVHRFVTFVGHPCIIAAVNTYAPVFASWVGAHRVRIEVPFVAYRTPCATCTTRAERHGKQFRLKLPGVVSWWVMGPGHSLPHGRTG